MESGRTLIAGANGHLGRRLLREWPGARALVRSERAASTIRGDGLANEIAIADYADVDAVTAALSGCRSLVHLVGILKEGSTTRYEQAHPGVTRALLEAAGQSGVKRVVYLSILGADPASANACLRTKGEAERILLDGPVPSVVLRLPMVLGPGDAASAALRGQARASLLPLVRGGRSLDQPIDAADVVAAVGSALDDATPAGRAVDLAGPECLSHRELVMRAARLWDNRPRVVPIPYALVYGVAAVVQRLSKDPPITVPMLEVLEHDDRVADPVRAARGLGVVLTPLDETLRRCVGPDARSDGPAPPEAP